MLALIGLALPTIFVGLWIAHDRSLSDLQQADTIRIGYAVEPPYALIEPGGDVSGEFPAVARRLAHDLGIAQVEWVQASFDALIPGLEAGQFDVIAAGMYITPERARRVAFSDPLLHVQQGLLVAAGNPRGLASYQEAARRADVRLAVIAGAVEEDLLRRMGIAESQIVAVPDARTGRAAVASGVVDGLALSAPTIRWMAATGEFAGVAMAEPFTQPDAALTHGLGYAGFAFRPGDQQLRRAWNAAQRAFVDSPEHREIMAQFAFVEAELPGSITTAEVLTP